jgi:hypothetical protein
LLKGDIDLEIVNLVRCLPSFAVPHPCQHYNLQFFAAVEAATKIRQERRSTLLVCALLVEDPAPSHASRLLPRVAPSSTPPRRQAPCRRSHSRRLWVDLSALFCTHSLSGGGTRRCSGRTERPDGVTPARNGRHQGSAQAALAIAGRTDSFIVCMWSSGERAREEASLTKNQEHQEQQTRQPFHSSPDDANRSTPPCMCMPRVQRGPLPGAGDPAFLSIRQHVWQQHGVCGRAHLLRTNHSPA